MRVFRALVICLIPALVLGVFAWTALAKLGLIRNPWDPTIGGDIAAARSSGPGYRVLFVGDSLTFRNDLPGMVGRLAVAKPGPVPLIVVSDTRPATSLGYWAANGQLRRLIADVPWDVVILQEQSVIPALAPADRTAAMDAPLHSLDAAIRADGGGTMLFETWAHEYGDFTGDSYEAMQQRIDDAYKSEGAAVGARVAPVGMVWARAHQLAPSLGLWDDDDTHPSTEGTYLAACVFYEMLTGRSPVGNPYVAGIDPLTARMLQQIAAANVSS